MVCPTLISVSLVPGPYCFWASAGCADSAAIAAPSSPNLLPNIGFLHFSCCGGSVGERPDVGKEMRLPALADQQCKLKSRSGRARLGGLLGLSPLGADRFARACRPDAERRSCGGRCDRGFRLRSEERPASRRELRFVPDHA